MPRTNLLMITCHDIGQHLGCYGIDTVHTENLDALARRGVRFENAFSTSAVCSPGRGSLHTGRYPQSNGLVGLTHPPFNWALHDDERHTAQVLSDAGYATYLVGFNHISDPARLGYQHTLSEHRLAHKTVRATLDLIEHHTTTAVPFFAKVGFTEVHRPFTHGTDTSNGLHIPGYLADTPAMRQDLAEFQATIRFFDERVGEIVSALAQSSISENTLLVMTSDHGIPYPGAKWTIRDAGIEVPLILYQPGSVLDGGRVLPQLISNVDILPTLLDWLDVPIPDNIQGMSFAPFLRGESATAPRNEVFAQFTPDMLRDNLSRCVRTDRFKLIRYFDQGRSVVYPTDADPKAYAAHTIRCKRVGSQRPFVELCDLEQDPFELNNIASESDYVHVVADLSNRLLAWMRDVHDPLLRGPLRTPYYQAALNHLLGGE